MLVRAGLARLGCLPSWRCLSSVPRIGELRTVRQVVDAHAQKGKRCTPVNLRSWWNTLGKLVRQPDERRVLQGAPGMLHPLAKQTEQALPQFDARSLATTVNGLAKLHASRCWRASDALWTGLATHCKSSQASTPAKRARASARARQTRPQHAFLQWST